MQLKYVAIDDEPLALDLITAYATRLPVLQLMQTFDDAVSGSKYLRNNNVDLLFIDINMPDINGVELVKSMLQKPMIVFTTAYKKFAVDAFELDAVDYLLKPIDFTRFEKAVKKATDFFQYKNAPQQNEEQSLFVRAEYQLIKIGYNDIEYIESVEDYLKIHITTGKYIMTRMTVKAMLEKLPPQQFQRIHRSYIVPLAKIKSLHFKKVRLAQIELPVSNSYSDFIKHWKR